MILPGVHCQNGNNKVKKIQLHENINSGIPDINNSNNNFYDDEETIILTPVDLEICGEIENPGKVDFSKFTRRTVIVKETLLNTKDSNTFIGAYRYDGYSLFDILNERILKKKNEEEFRPIIDVFVEIENANGEKAVMS